MNLAISELTLDDDIQSREAINDETVAEYTEAVKAGDDFPPLTVFSDGQTYWLADGFHRFFAFKKAGASEVAIDLRDGERRDALLYAVGANANHGLRRTNADKRRAVLTLLNDKEWGGWSDREIARRCRVSNNFVSSIRQQSSLSSDDSERTYTTKHGTTAQMSTSNIGKPKEVIDYDTGEVIAPLSPWEERQAVIDEAGRQPMPTRNPVKEYEEFLDKSGYQKAASVGRHLGELITTDDLLDIINSPGGKYLGLPKALALLRHKLEVPDSKEITV